jgi:hypothetical protein
MSSYYKALPRLIPEFLLMAKPGEEVAIVSPWIEDVVIWPPMCANDDPSWLSEVRLSQFLTLLCCRLSVRLLVIVRNRSDWRVRPVLRHVLDTCPRQIAVYESPTLHAKAIINSNFILDGSANLLEYSLYRNVEKVTVERNTEGSARAYARREWPGII